jgi:protein-L-isoaspartate(D-aspartate) O-methyltransferase
MAVIDSYRHKGLRKRMVALLQEKGIKDERVLAVMMQIPRHFFLDSAFVEHAYENKPFPIEAEQTISQPYTVAYMTVLLEVEPGQKILEIGTGSGYQASVLAELGADVHTIERHEILSQTARAQLNAMGYERIHTYYGDGYLGLESEAPFDRIIVTAGAPEVPTALRLQLRVGGSMVIPVGKDQQVMMRITRTSETNWKDERFAQFRFVPFLKGVSGL